MIQKINQIMDSLDGTIAQIGTMNESINKMSQNFSEEIVSLTENVRLIVEVLKQFRVQSSKSVQELSDNFNDQIKELYEQKSIEAILDEEKKAIETIKKASKSVADNLYYAQLLTIIQSIREETNRLMKK
jgi:RNA polymerase-binding transcription factor DksA